MGSHRTGEDWAMNHLDPPAIAFWCLVACGLFAKLTLTLSAGASCLLSGFDMHGEIDAFGSDQEYIK